MRYCHITDHRKEATLSFSPRYSTEQGWRASSKNHNSVSIMAIAEQEFCNLS